MQHGCDNKGFFWTHFLKIICDIGLHGREGENVSVLLLNIRIQRLYVLRDIIELKFPQYTMKCYGRSTNVCHMVFVW